MRVVILIFFLFIVGSMMAQSESQVMSLSDSQTYGVVSDKSLKKNVDSIIPAHIIIDPAQGVAPLAVQISTPAPALSCTWIIEGMTFTDISAFSHVFQHAGSYDVCLFTLNHGGFKDSACSVVQVWAGSQQDSSFLVVPNVFTPNNDLQNDFFRTTSLNIVEWDSRIYNRWGQLVYNSTAADVMWDGLNNGTPCDDGVYVFIIKAVGGDGKLYDISGTLTLFR
ncbi:MAG TPA: gliding motility-associated C-terminal domain-containing protein [Bacteroidales bacterium]|nr:gliding motility-associated C-terminal domain-containing protein [Bacteroidales bacterium]